MLNNVDECPCRCAFDVFEFRLSKHVPRNSFYSLCKTALNTEPKFGRVSLIQDWILKSEEIQEQILRFFTGQINPTSKFHPLNETGVNKELAIMLLAILTRWTRLYEPLEM